MFFIGKYFTGRVRWLDGQGVETEFLWFFLPVIPMRSLYVIKKCGRQRQGIGINLNVRSILKTYLVWWPLPVTAALCLWLQWPMYWLLVSLAFSALILLLGITPQCKQRRIRKVLGQVLGVNAMPQWLDEFNRNHLHQRSLEKLKYRMGDDMPSLSDQSRPKQRWTYKCLLAYTVYHEGMEKQEQSQAQQDELLSLIYPGTVPSSLSPS